MLPAENTYYRKGMTLGLTLAEIFSIIVFVLLLAFAVLLSRERSERQAVEQQRDTAVARHEAAEADLLIVREVISRSEDISWASADIWIRETQRMREELAVARREVEAARAEAKAARAETETARLALQQARVAAAEAQSLLDSADVPGAAAKRVQAQAAELAALRQSLSEAEENRSRAGQQLAEAEQRADQAVAREQSLREQFAYAERTSRQLREEMATQGGLTPEQAENVIEQAARTEPLADSLDDARATISALGRELNELGYLSASDSAAAIDSLRADLVQARVSADSLRFRDLVLTRERNDAVSRAEYREAELERYRQGLGIDPPPCWLDPQRNPEYIFRIELTNGGLRLFKVAPAHLLEEDPEAARYASQMEDGREYSPTEFRRLAEPFYRLGVGRTSAFGPLGCRFWVRPVDLTGDAKDVFRARERELWRYFWFRW